MEIIITKKATNSTGSNIRTYYSDDRDTVKRFLDAYKADKLGELMPMIDTELTCLHNDMSVSFDPSKQLKVTYNIVIKNRKILINTTI